MIPLALNRIANVGVYVGSELYYQQSAQFMFVVCLGFALSTRWGGPRRPLPSWLGTAKLVPLGVVAALAYGALYVSSADSFADTSGRPRIAKEYVHQFMASVERVRAATGREPNLIDATVPYALMQSNFAPFNRYSFFFGVVDDHLRYDEPGGPQFVVSPAGRLQRVHFVATARGILRRATFTDLADSTHTGPAGAPGAACALAGGLRQLKIPLGSPQRLVSDPLPSAVEVSYRTPARSNVPVLASAGAHKVLVSDDPHFWGPGDGRGLAIVRTDMVAQAIELYVPGGTCVHDLKVGRFELAG
jgi:hypothetical protein